jgi:hypothetical protein
MIATLIPALPVDLVYLVFDYAPGVALEVFPAYERIEVVRRLTGLTLSDERASLVLEQRNVGNRDFDDLTLAADEEAWYDALQSAFSPRAFDELVRIGQIQPPFTPERARKVAMRSLCHGGDHGLALARHLEHLGPEMDILGAVDVEELASLAGQVEHPPTVQYLLHRLLDVHDRSFVVRKQQQLSTKPEFVLAFCGAPVRPLHLLVYELYYICNGQELHKHGWSCLPLLDAFIASYPHARILFLECAVSVMMDIGRLASRIATMSSLSGARPSGAFTFAYVLGKFVVTYGSYQRFLYDIVASHQITCLYGWLIDDWLAQNRRESEANDSNDLSASWQGVPDMISVFSRDKTAITRIVQGVPDKVLVHHCTQSPTLLHTFYLCTTAHKVQHYYTHSTCGIQIHFPFT